MFDDFLRKLNDLKRNAEQLNGEHVVPLSELFPDEFMLRQTDFASIESMMEANGFPVSTQEEFLAIPDEAWDKIVQQRTRFESWEEMKGAAVKAWTAKRLGLE